MADNYMKQEIRKRKHPHGIHHNRQPAVCRDIMVSAYACDFTIALLANDGSKKYRVDAESFFDKDPETWSRISRLKAKSTESKRAEYEQKKLN